MSLILNHQNKILLVAFNQKIQQEAQVQERVSNQADISETLTTQAGGFLAFTFFWVGFLVLASKKLKRASYQQIDSYTNSLPNHRCTQCQYFAKNHFLKCAVQPSFVLTEKANTCLDYCPKNQNL